MQWGKTSVGVLTWFLALAGAPLARNSRETGNRSIYLGPLADKRFKVDIYTDLGKEDPMGFPANVKTHRFSDREKLQKFEGGLQLPESGPRYFTFDSKGQQLLPKDPVWPQATSMGRHWSSSYVLINALRTGEYHSVRKEQIFLEQCLEALPKQRFGSFNELIAAYNTRNKQIGCHYLEDRVSQEALLCVMSSFTNCNWSSGLDTAREDLRQPSGSFTILELFANELGGYHFFVSGKDINVSR